jgi:hypothetical protein
MNITEKDETFSKFGPIRRCIYCGTETNFGLPLQDEHIFPLSIGGIAEIREASCKQCADHTAAIEGKCAEHIFKRVRRRENLKSRRRYKPAAISLNIYSDGPNLTVDVPIEKIPTSLTLPVLEPPGIALGRPINFQPLFCLQTITYRERAGEIADFVGAKSWIRWERKFDYPTHHLLRVLAKIAHCHAVATIGNGTFVPFLPSIILGEDTEKIPYFIGCTDPPIQPRHKFKVHRIATKILHPVPDEALKVVCDLQLFANLGTPRYRIVVGDLL